MRPGGGRGWLSLAGLAAIVLVLVHFDVFRSVYEMLVFVVLPYCPVDDAEHKFLATDLNGDNNELGASYSTVNTWFPAKPVEGVNFQTLCPVSEDIDLLIFIISSTKNRSIERREKSRGTWLRKENIPQGVKYFFVLAWSEVSSENDIVKAEVFLHKDILVLDFLDTYQNLTLKTMSALKWIAINCQRTENILKTDDDVYVNTPKILAHLKRPDSPASAAIVGKCNHFLKVIRDPNHRYFVPRSEYGLRYYPPYCIGGGYVVSMNTLQSVVRMSFHVPLISMEDVFVAVCANCVGIGVKSLTGFVVSFEVVSQEGRRLDEYFMVHDVP